MGDFIVCFAIQADIHYSSPIHVNGKRAQINKPMQQSASVDLESNERNLGSEHKFRLDQTAKLLEG